MTAGTPGCKPVVAAAGVAGRTRPQLQRADRELEGGQLVDHQPATSVGLAGGPQRSTLTDMRQPCRTRLGRLATSVAIAAVLVNVVLVALHAMATASRVPGSPAPYAAFAGPICGPAPGIDAASLPGGPADGGDTTRPRFECAICSGALAAAWLAGDANAAATPHAADVSRITFLAPSDHDRGQRRPFETRSRGPPAAV